jgi:hypothetical protein
MKKKIIGYACIAFALGAVAWGQETTAGIQGTVKDPSGAAVSGATLEAESPALIGLRSTTSGEDGVYRFTDLPPGIYTVAVKARGFRTAKLEEIILQTGRLAIVDARLVVGAVTETMEVTDAAASVDVTSSKVAVTVDRKMLDGMPTGRSFQ